MALLHPSSAPAAPECLELFKIAETQTGVERIYAVNLSPISTETGGSYEFGMSPYSNEYVDLHKTLVYGQMRVVHEDGTALAADEIAVPINLIMQTRWQQVDVKYGNTIVSRPQQLFPYKSIIKYVLMHNAETKNTQGATQGYYKERAGYMDSLTLKDHPSVRSRLKLCQESKWFDFEGHPLEDTMQFDRYFLNNVSFHMKLNPACSKFCIMAADTTKSYRMEYKNVMVKVFLVKVSSGVLVGHAKALSQMNALYPFTRVEMMSFSIPKGDSNVNINNLTRTTVPTRIVICMVTSEAFNGSYAKNPFNFQHFDVSNISLIVNETVVGGQPLRMNFDRKNAKGRDYVSAYNNMFTSTGTDGTNFGNDIQLDEFPDGYAFFCFNLEPFAKAGKYLNLVENGFVRLSMQFAKPLEETIVLIAYAEHQKMLQIDAARNVLM